jgi:hypothetical protein
MAKKEEPPAEQLAGQTTIDEPVPAPEQAPATETLAEEDVVPGDGQFPNEAPRDEHGLPEAPTEEPAVETGH